MSNRIADPTPAHVAQHLGLQRAAADGSAACSTLRLRTANSSLAAAKSDARVKVRKVDLETLAVPTHPTAAAHLDQAFKRALSAPALTAEQRELADGDRL